MAPPQAGRTRRAPRRHVGPGRACQGTPGRGWRRAREGLLSALVGSLVWLTPLGALAFLAVAIPLAGLMLVLRREQYAREVLGLGAPAAVRRLPRMAAVAAVFGFLGLAAMQPALRSVRAARVRTDAQAFFVLDVSRSMLASRTPTSQTRIARAKQLALAIRAAVPHVPVGIATLTDRVLPNLFPVADANVFAQTLAGAVAIEEPPPTSSSVVATSLAALGALGTQNFFPPSARRRVVVVLTDGESAPFDPGAVAHDLASAAVRLVLVQVGSTHDLVYDGGRPEQGYHAAAESGALLDSLATASGGRVFAEGGMGATIRSVRAALGNGPAVTEGRTERTRTLAPYVALLALVPLALLFARLGGGLGRAVRTRAAHGRWWPAGGRTRSTLNQEA